MLRLIAAIAALCLSCLTACGGGGGGGEGNPPPVVQDYSISATASPSDGGVVTGAGTYSQGTNVTLTATENTGYTFVNWTENSVEVSASNSYSFSATNNRSLVATFSINNYAIEASVNPSQGGSVTGAGNYEHGVEATVIATQNEGYTFVNWTEDGEEVSTSNNYTFTAESDGSLVANFILKTEFLNGSYEGDKKSPLGVFEINLAFTTFDISGTDITITLEDFFAETYIFTGQFSDLTSPMSASGTYQGSDFSSGTWTSTKIAKTKEDAFIVELEMNDGVNTYVIKFNGFLQFDAPAVYSNEPYFYFDSGNYLDIGGVYTGTRVSRDVCAASTFPISASDMTIEILGDGIELTQDEFFDGTCVFVGTIEDTSIVPLTANGTYMCSNFDEGTWSSSNIVQTGIDSFIAELVIDVPSRGCTYTKTYSGFK